MCTEQGDSITKKKLRSLCCSNGWSYGVFWRFDQRNSLYFTIDEAYYEEQIGALIDNMLLQVHVLGGGTIGRVAFTKRHQWMFSDADYEEYNPLGSVESQDLFLDDSEFHHQFASGIKTIAVISVEPWGVVQLGSTQKVFANSEFVYHTRSLFEDTENSEELMLLENASSSSKNEANSIGGLFASLISSGNSYCSNPKPLHSANCKDMTTAASPSSLTWSKRFPSDHTRLTLLTKNLSYHSNQLGTSDIGNQDTFPVQPIFQSPTCINFSSAQTSSSTWNCEDSSLTSLNQPPPFEMRSHDSQHLNKKLRFSSFQGTEMLAESKKISQNNSGNLINTQNCTGVFNAGFGKLSERTDNHYVFEDFFQENDFDASLPKPCQMDELYQWFASSPDNSIGTLATASNEDLAHVVGLNPSASNVNGGDKGVYIPFNHPTNSVQSSVTSTSNVDEEEKYSKLLDAKSDLFESFTGNFGYAQTGDWDDMPIINCGHLDFSRDSLECILEKHVGSRINSQSGVFFGSGLEYMSDNVANSSLSVSKSKFEDQLSCTTRTISSSVCSNQLQLSGLPRTDGNMNSLQSVYKQYKNNNLGIKEIVFPKSENSSWHGNSYSMNVENTILQTKKYEKSTKVTKKKMKKASRPRPKDRQQIQDRMSELRELIPKGEKMSIDCLLAQSIKKLTFLQGVTKHADRLKQANDPMQNVEILKDTFRSSSNNSVTWACEVGGQSMVCPLIVEDLSIAGQMHIEMLCEEQGFFLEIVDVIRGFGLTILKGVMEIRETKIWARFIVVAEGSKLVTRHEIFSSLLQLLQVTNTSGFAPIDQLDCSIQQLPATYDASPNRLG